MNDSSNKQMTAEEWVEMWFGKSNINVAPLIALFNNYTASKDSLISSQAERIVELRDCLEYTCRLLRSVAGNRTTPRDTTDAILNSTILADAEASLNREVGEVGK